MTLTPEAQIIVVNAIILLVAYLGIYPAIRNVTPMRMAKIDVLLSGLSLLIAGLLFGGAGVRFTMFLFSTNWMVFAFVTMFLMEIPLFYWFCRSRGLNPFEMDGD